MMPKRGGGLLAALAGCLIAACTTTDTHTEMIQPTDPNYGPVVGEVKDARTRAKAHTDLAAAYYELGNVGVALEEVRIAIAADANYAPAYNVQGLVNMDLRENGAAEASFQRGLKLAPQDPDLNHNYGWFLCQTGREDQSLPWFMNAVRSPLYPTPAKSFAAAGRCLQKRDPAEAMKYYDRALRIDPNNLQALLPYAEILYRRGQLRPAKELVGRYNKLVPEPTAESLWLALRIERKLGDQFAESSLATQLRRRYSNSNEFQSLQRGNYD
ncbi:MAG TPA: type IV pilus biogenesis/stability protein PilW [Burkholderiales bacterium]|nr:type IV pilus biogenesis/stability protein PilW [Burkholderiales bacterium]